MTHELTHFLSIVLFQFYRYAKKKGLLLYGQSRKIVESERFRFTKRFVGKTNISKSFENFLAGHIATKFLAIPANLSFSPRYSPHVSCMYFCLYCNFPGNVYNEWSTRAITAKIRTQQRTLAKLDQSKSK